MKSKLNRTKQIQEEDAEEEEEGVDDGEGEEDDEDMDEGFDDDEVRNFDIVNLSL